MSKKSWIIIIVFVILLAGLAVAGVYYWAQLEMAKTSTNSQKVITAKDLEKQQLSKQLGDSQSQNIYLQQEAQRVKDELASSTRPKIDPLADWKTYSNERYSINFKYPKNFVLKEEFVGRATVLKITDSIDSQKPGLWLYVDFEGGPFFYNQKYTIKETDGRLQILDSVDEPNNANNTNNYFTAFSSLVASNKHFYIWSFRVNKEGQDAFEPIFKTILESTQFFK